MSWLSSLFASNPWDRGEVPVPWDKDRPSLFRFVEAHLDPEGGGLTKAGQTLPDEEIRFAGQEFRWVAGGMDGAFGHHGGGGAEAKVDAVFAALRRALAKPNFDSLQQLYALLVADDLLDFLDPLVKRLASAGAVIDLERLGKLGRLFATGAPDRGPVKFGIAMCGAIAGAADRALIRTLGRHEEFTLYALVALTNQAACEGDDPEQEIWDLAKRVHGWGRIHAVERLAGTENPEIKAWLLREGYRNAIMNEYLAHIAATSGGLVEALRDPDPDDALMRGAGEIIDALLQGGPAEDIDDYDEAPEAVSLYLGHLRHRARALTDLVSVGSIKQFLDREEGWEARREKGWTDERRRALRAVADGVLGQPHWHEAVTEGLAEDDSAAFWQASRAARLVGIDPWEHAFERQRAGRDDHWFDLMQTDDPDRIDRVIALAEEVIPLDEIATGPAEELGLGPGFGPHGALDFILQGLRRFPGRGWTLVRAALASPVVRNRNMAIVALADWGRESWPAEAAEVLSQAAGREPDPDVRKNMEAVLEGRPLVDPATEQDWPDQGLADEEDDRS